MPDRPECDEFACHLLPDELPLEPPPHHGDGGYEVRDDENTALANRDGYVVVAGDGFCLGRASDLRARRSGYALHCGNGHPCSIEAPLKGVA
eukprot:8997362-Pyramimonas_sp.AAC.1